MAAATALIVVIFRDGTRSTPLQFPASAGHRAWFTEAMAYTLAGIGERRDFASMVVIAPDGEVSHYNRGEVAEVLGVA